MESTTRNQRQAIVNNPEFTKALEELRAPHQAVIETVSIYKDEAAVTEAVVMLQMIRRIEKHFRKRASIADMTNERK